jgi:hypothetical protein
MNAFEFVFPLFGLLVGLSIAEMLSGLATALKSKRDIRVGWLTPLLGTLILINLTMFWQGSWQIRDAVTATSTSLLLVLVVGGTYFLAASMVFPSRGAQVDDLDEHFMDNRKVALLAIAACNLAYFIRIALATEERVSLSWWAGNALFLALLLVAALTPSRRLILAALGALIAAHGVMLFLG